MTTENMVLKNLQQERAALAARIDAGVKADNGHYQEWMSEISLLGDLDEAIEWCCRGAAADHSARLAEEQSYLDPEVEDGEDDTLPF